MAFDPDAYLASAKAAPAKKAGGFDPDAYLAKVTAKPAVEPSHDIPVGVRAPEPEPSFLDRTKQRIGDAVTTIGTGAMTAGHALRHPIETVTDPSKRRELERGLDDMVTAGYGQRIAGWVGHKLGDSPDVDLNATRAGDAENAPGYRAAGNLAGMFTPGVASTLGKAGGALAGKALGGVATGGAASGAAMGAARGVLGYQAGAVPLAALQAGAQGGNPLEAARNAATDPVGLALSAGGGAVGGAGRGAAAHMRDPHTLEGRTLAAVDAAGGEVRPFGKPVRGGLFESPALTELKNGRAGMNELAADTAEEFKTHNREKLAQERKTYGQAVDGILAEHADRLHGATATHDVLDSLEKRAVLSNGKVANKALHDVVTGTRDLLTSDLGQLDQRASAAEGKPVYQKVPAVKVEDMLKVKQAVNDGAEWGSPSTVHNAPYRLIAHALNEDAANVDPRIKQINAEYGKTMEGLKEANDIVFASRKVDVKDSAAKSKSAALKLGRVGDDTQAGTTDGLERLRQLDPKYAEQLRLLEAKKAMERLRYGEPEVSTSIEKGMGRASKHALLPAIGAGLGLTHGPLGMMVGAAAGKAAENPFALKLRLGLPAADYAGRATGVTPGLTGNRLVDLAQARKKQQAEAAAGLAGGQ